MTILSAISPNNQLHIFRLLKKSIENTCYYDICTNNQKVFLEKQKKHETQISCMFIDICTKVV